MEKRRGILLRPGNVEHGGRSGNADEEVEGNFPAHHAPGAEKDPSDQQGCNLRRAERADLTAQQKIRKIQILNGRRAEIFEPDQRVDEARLSVRPYWDP